MMMWLALGGLALVTGAAGFAFVMYGRDRYEAGRQSVLSEQAERRSLRRMETRQAAYTARHQAAPWPGPDPATQLATTGELRALAETGDIAEIERTNAAFMRIFDLIAHTRRREHTA